jgi:hypothetical protein
MKRFCLGSIVKCAVMFVALIAAISWVVMYLWNGLLPELFGWPSLRFVQALGLLVLCRILFGGLRVPGGGRHWHRQMFERWEQMTPEEREKLRSGLRNRCGPWGDRS